MSESDTPEAAGNDSRAWLAVVMRGAHGLVWSPVAWLAVTPVAVVFHRPAVVAAALFQLLGTWLLTWRREAPPEPALARLAWLLRALSLSAVPMVYASSLGYRALLLAELAARGFYLSRLAPRLGKPRSAKYFVASAVGCAASAALLGGDLAWRVFTHALTLDPWTTRLVGMSAVPFAVGGWLLLAELVARRPELGQRAWWEYGFGVVLDLGFGCVLAFGSGLAGFTVSWSSADGDPGVRRGAMALCLLAGMGAFLAIHFAIHRNHARLRRALAVCALVQVPFIWTLLFRPEFSSERWKRFARENGACDGSMAEDLAYSAIVIGKTRTQVEQLLGPPRTWLNLDSRVQAQKPKATASRFFYDLKRGEPCQGLNVMFERGVASETELVVCDD